MEGEGEGLLKCSGESLEGNLGLHLPSPYMIFTELGPHFSGRSAFCGSVELTVICTVTVFFQTPNVAFLL